MHKSSRAIQGIALLAGLAVATPLVHQSVANAKSRAHKAAICHGTASASNPYVLIIVDRSAIKGHFDGTAPGHGKNNHPDYMVKDYVTPGEESYLRSLGNSACRTGNPEPDPGS